VLLNLIAALAGLDADGTPLIFGDCTKALPAEPWFAGFFPPLNDFILFSPC
jgi:hypothetical protein